MGAGVTWFQLSGLIVAERLEDVMIFIIDVMLLITEPPQLPRSARLRSRL